tara:strand:- start:737 stop:1513 length:777 start_codon:yes stop_codon:yes gene_type:complete
MSRFVTTKSGGGSSSGGGAADGNDYMWKRIYHCAKWDKDYGYDFKLNLPTCDYQAFRFRMDGVKICPSQHMCWCFGFGYNNGQIQGNNNKYYGWCNWCWPSRSCCCWNAWGEGHICAWAHQSGGGSYEGAGIFDMCIFQWGQCAYSQPCCLCQVGFDLKWRSTEYCGWRRRWGYTYDWLSAMDWIPKGAPHNSNWCGCTFDTLCICAPQSVSPASCAAMQSGDNAYRSNWALYGIPWGHVHDGDSGSSSGASTSGLPT